MTTTPRTNPALSNVERIVLRTVNGTEYVDVFFRGGRKLNLKGPRSGMKCSESRVNNVIRVNVEFHGFEVVE